MSLEGGGCVLRAKASRTIGPCEDNWLEAFRAVRIAAKHKRNTIHVMLHAWNAVRRQALVVMRIEDDARLIRIKDVLRLHL